MAGKVAKVPQIMQMEALECGAACIAMILAYYGRWVPLEKVRADCGVSRDGSKASNMLKAARSYGLQAQGLLASTNALRKRGPFPCIVFWNFNHFVVVDGFRGNHVYLNDPARGQVKITLSEFEESYSGVALIFKKTDAFQEGGEKPDVVGYAKHRLEGLGGAIAFVMVTSAIASLLAILNTALGSVFLDRILTGDNADWITPFLVILFGVAVVSSVVSVLNAVHLMHIQGKIAVVSSARFMRHLLHLPVGFYAQRLVGDLQQRQSNNESIAYSLVICLAPVLVNTIMLVLYLAVMLHYSIALTAIGLLCVAINAALARILSRKRVNIARFEAMSAGKLYATTVSGIEMIETIKAAGAENGYFSRWAGYQAAVNEAEYRAARLNEYLGAVPTIVTSLADIFVLVLGIWLIVRGDFTPGALLAFTGFLSSFMAPVTEMIDLGQTVQEMRTQMERIEDVMHYDVDVPESREDELAGGKASADGSAGSSAGNGAVKEEAQAAPWVLPWNEKLKGRIDLQGVTFGYSPLEKPVIEGFDLHVEPGKWVALVGSSGCGKSTIAKLVGGLYEPWEGSVLFDGVPLADVPRSALRGSLAVVDQDVVTFDDSISNNVKLWDNSIEDYEVILACRDAGIHDVVVERQGGYESRILPGGSNFSGGQLQRLEIARVLAQDPTIIILDEATSALDAQTEAEVVKRIRDRGITCIVVAHRLSTIRDCDEIVVLDEGKVVERGTHDELLAFRGVYAELVESD